MKPALHIFAALMALVLLSGCAAMNSLIFHPLSVLHKQHEYNEHAEANRKLGEQMIKDGWGKEGQK